MQLWRQYGRWILLGTILVVTGLLIGLIIQLPTDRQEPLAVETLPAAEVAEIGEKSILPQTQVTVRYTFLKCGHILEQAYANRELVGLTGAQVETLWNNAHVKELEQAQALIERDMPACCPAHYLLITKTDDSLWYNKTDEQDYTRQTETEIPFDVSVLHEDVQEALREGIVFDHLHEIDAYLEGVES